VYFVWDLKGGLMSDRSVAEQDRGAGVAEDCNTIYL